MNFDKDNISDRVLKKIGQYCSMADFQVHHLYIVSLIISRVRMFFTFNVTVMFTHTKLYTRRNYLCVFDLCRIEFTIKAYSDSEQCGGFTLY